MRRNTERNAGRIGRHRASESLKRRSSVNMDRMTLKRESQGFNGLERNLGNLFRLSNAQSRSISPENFTGEKGKGGMATEGTGKQGRHANWARAGRCRLRSRIKAKSTFTVAEIDGPGAIQQIWMTPAPMDKTRLYILRFYWDGETEPSIEVPLGDFFACGWGKYCQINSLPVCVNPGSAFNCYWTMPFRKKAKITLENLDDKDMTLYYQVNYTLTDVPDDAAYFHAQFRRVHKLPAKTVYTILDGVSGRGQYVGTYMAWEVHSPGWWGEGEIKFYIDGDQQFPTICGTGTEDYFCGSYNFENRQTHRYQTFSTPYSGLAQVLPPEIDLRAGPAIRPVSLAHRRSDPLREGSEGDDPGPGLEAEATDHRICRWRTTSPRWPTGIRPSRTPSFHRCQARRTWPSSPCPLPSPRRSRPSKGEGRGGGAGYEDLSRPYE